MGLVIFVRNTDDGLIRLDLDLRKEYNEILLPEELLWFQKSREKWVRNGDRNTKYFHSLTNIRRRRRGGRNYICVQMMQNCRRKLLTLTKPVLLHISS